MRGKMNFKKIISVVLVVAGALMIAGAYSIKNQVAQGKIQLSDAESTVNTGKALFSVNPVSKEVGNQLTKSVDRKIAEGHDQIAFYSKLAENLIISGIVLIVIGVGLFIFYGRRSGK